MPDPAIPPKIIYLCSPNWRSRKAYDPGCCGPGAITATTREKDFRTSDRCELLFFFFLLSHTPQAVLPDSSFLPSPFGRPV